MAKSKEVDSIDTKAGQSKDCLSRRDMLFKDVAYTAPVVITMLAPEQAYAMSGSTPYSTIATCQAVHSGRQATNMHCARRHPIG